MNTESSLKNLRELIGKTTRPYGKKPSVKKPVSEHEKLSTADGAISEKSSTSSFLPGFPDTRTPIPLFTLAPDLPVSRDSAVLEKAIRDNPVIIVSGESGTRNRGALLQVPLPSASPKK